MVHHKNHNSNIRRRKSKTKGQKTQEENSSNNGPTEIFVACHPYDCDARRRSNGNDKLTGWLCMGSNILTFRSENRKQIYYRWDYASICMRLTKEQEGGIVSIVVLELPKTGQTFEIRVVYEFISTETESDELKKQRSIIKKQHSIMNKLLLGLILSLISILALFLAKFSGLGRSIVGYLNSIKHRRIRMELNLTHWHPDMVQSAEKAGMTIGPEEFLENDVRVTHQVSTCNRPENLKRALSFLLNEKKGILVKNVLVMQDANYIGTETVIRNFGLDLTHAKKGKFSLGHGHGEYDYLLSYGKGYNYTVRGASSIIDDVQLFSSKYLGYFEKVEQFPNANFVIYGNEITCEEQFAAARVEELN